MSTLWTPGGERPIPKDPKPETAATGADGSEPSEEEMQAELAELQAQLARTPAAVVIANHAFGLFELAALHLSLERPQLEEARLAIDALAALVEGLGDRLGSHAEELSAGLGQLRMAFVQIHASVQGGRGEPPG
jgi:hypothetical protein